MRRKREIERQNAKKEKKMTKWKKMCKIQKVFSSAFQNKIQNSKYSSFCFSFFRQKVSFYSILCNHKVCSQRVVHATRFNVCGKKKLHQKGSINVQKLQNSDEGKNSKNGKNVISGGWAKRFMD